MNGGAVEYGGGCTARPWAPQHRGAPALCRATYSGCCEEDPHDPQRVPAGGSPSRTMLPWGLRCLTGSPRRSSMATAGLLAQPPSRAQCRARPRQRVWMCPEDYHNLVNLKRGVSRLGLALGLDVQLQEPEVYVSGSLCGSPCPTLLCAY